MTLIFTMSSKGLLTLVLKLHDLFWIIYDTYEGWKSKNHYEQQRQSNRKNIRAPSCQLKHHCSKLNFLFSNFELAAGSVFFYFSTSI